jgi:hypothetical protein
MQIVQILRTLWTQKNRTYPRTAPFALEILEDRTVLSGFSLPSFSAIGAGFFSNAIGPE